MVQSELHSEDERREGNRDPGESDTNQTTSRSSESIESEDSTDEILKTQQDTEGTQQQLTESES